MSEACQDDLNVLKALDVEPYAVSVEQFVTQAKIQPSAVKLGSEALFDHQKTAGFLTTYAGKVVAEPDTILTEPQLYVDSLRALLPFVDVVIVNSAFSTYEAIQQAAHALVDLGVKSVLVKANHVRDVRFSQDYWTDGQESFWIATQRLAKQQDSDAGGILSSAITACLARGFAIKDAIVIARMVVQREIVSAADKGNDQTRLLLQGWPEDQAFLPFVSPHPLVQLPQPFKRCELGLYPIVNNSHWLEKLIPQGVTCIQLRIKNTPTPILEQEIQRSVTFVNQTAATLFINDYWELAIRFGAGGIHLGQDDLHTADLEAIQRAGLCLGVSTHGYYEVARAHAINPSYIACGPVYATTSKVTSYEPQGVEQLRRWRRTLHYPLVAIGGISMQRLPDILHSGVEGVASISAITEASDPIAVTRQFLEQINNFKTLFGVFTELHSVGFN